MKTITDAPVRTQVPVRKRVATGLVALAGLCSLTALAGWVLDDPLLRGFGFRDLPIWPLTASGYLALSLGFAAAINDRWTLAKLLWAWPVLLAMLSILQNSLGIDIGTDLLLFPDAIQGYGRAHPGRPGANATTMFLLYAAAGYGSERRIFLRTDSAGLIASGALGLAVAVTILMLFAAPQDPFSQAFAVSVPSALVVTLLGAAFIVWHRGFGWADLLTSDRPDRQLLRLLLPVGLVLPVLPTLADIAVMRSALGSPLASALVVVLSNVVIVALIAFWAVRRVTGEQRALVEMTEALQSATVALIGPDGRITHWSRGCETLYGWTAEEAVGQQKYALLRSRCQQGWGPSLPLRGLGDVLELVEIRQDGREIAVLERAHTLQSPGDGQVTVLTMSDISVTAATLSALRASEERLAVATAAHEVGVFEWDVATGKLLWSPGMEQRLGLVPGTMTDFESWRSQIDPEDVQGILDTIARAVAERAETFTFRYRFLQPNGNVRAVEGSAHAYYDETGNLVRTVGVMIDTTERDDREAVLLAREAQLRSVLETVPDAMVVLDDEGTILRFNKAAEQLWGFRADSVLGRSFIMLAPADERARYSSGLAHFLKTRTRRSSQSFTALGEAADGRQFPLEARAGVARIDGKLLLTVFFRDLTERLATEERLSELNAELAHVSRQSAMSELAADLAHELNQPLSATSNFLAAARMLIDKGEDAERVTELLRMGTQQTQRAGEIIRRLRDFTARGETGAYPESLNEIVTEAIELVLVGTGQLHVQIDHALDPDVDMVQADRVQVQQVLVNLLRNAMQALRTVDQGKRAITIESRKIDDDMVEIEVRDTGPGIPASILESLFERFTTTKQKTGGMGIGLSISKRIIEAHGGVLSAGNRPEGGATFRFTLPVAGGDEE